MEKLKVKINAHNEVPSYKTEGASGFDIKVYDSNTILTKSIIDKILDDKDYSVLEMLYGDIKNAMLFISEEQFVKAICYKLLDLIKLDDGKYITLQQYMEANNLSYINLVLPHCIHKFNTGLRFEIPQGYELQVRPRSGISSKYLYDVKFGTVDNDYRGEVKVIVSNPSLNAYIIFPGERIAQGVITKVEQAEFEIVEETDFTETERGDKGFGSTGQN